MKQEESVRQNAISPSLNQIFRSPEKVFLLLGLLFGVLFLMAIPPFQVPDEPGHLYRAYQLSNGQILADIRPDVATAGNQYPAGGILPESLPKMEAIWLDRIPLRKHEKVKSEQFSKSLETPLKKHRKAFWPFMSVIYSPVLYMPQVIGVTVGKVLNLAPIWLIYFGRLSNLIATTLITFLSIKIIPTYKWVFFLLGLTPMAIAQRASLSADAMLNSVAFLLIAAVANCAFNNQKERVSIQDLAVISATSLGIALSKLIYFPLIFLLFLIPQKKFKTRQHYWWSSAAIILSSALVWFAWNLSIKEIVPTYSAIGASVGKQVEHLLSHPSVIFPIAWNSLQSINNVLDQFVGVLGWLDAPVPTITLIIYPYTLLLVALCEKQPNFTILRPSKFKILLIFASIVFLIYLSQYLIWTPVGASGVLGVQGRYFIPASPLLFLLFYNQNFSLNTSIKFLPIMVVCFSLFALTSSLMTTVGRYY